MKERPRKAQHVAGCVVSDSVGGSPLRMFTALIYSHIECAVKENLLWQSNITCPFLQKLWLTLVAWMSLELVIIFLLKISFFSFQSPTNDENCFYMPFHCIFFCYSWLNLSSKLFIVRNVHLRSYLIRGNAMITFYNLTFPKHWITSVKESSKHSWLQSIITEIFRKSKLRYSEIKWLEECQKLHSHAKYCESQHRHLSQIVKTGII